MPTYTPSEDHTDYVNTIISQTEQYDVCVDDRLQFRSNCYGYALRIHYGNQIFSDYDEDGYRQIPGEFYNKYGISMDFFGLKNYYLADYDNDGKIFDCNTIYRFITYDCSELGYSVTTVNSYSSTASFVPPSASSNQSERLIALVVKQNGSDFHFYMQNSDDIWSHKPGMRAATTKCAEHDVVLDNSNISQHIHCKTFDDAVEGYEGNVLLFRISAPGSSDRYNSSGHFEGVYFTDTSLLGVPGDYIFSAFPIQNVTSINTLGRIEYINDVDYYVFNVLESGDYTFSFQKNSYAYRVVIGEVVEGFSVTGSTVFTLTNTMSSRTISKSLQSGKIYSVRVTAYGQEFFDSNVHYTLGVSLNE